MREKCHTAPYEKYGWELECYGGHSSPVIWSLMVASPPWAVPGPPGRALRETCEQPKLLDFSPASWQLPGCCWMLCSPQKPIPAKAHLWAQPTSDAKARSVALRRQLQGWLSKPAQRNHFWGEILASELSSRTPAGAEDLEEDAYRTGVGRELGLGV